MSLDDLVTLGWTPALAQAFAPHAAAGLEPGRVSLEHNHVYRVMTANGERLAEAAGKIKYEASGRHELPAVGDWVGVRLNPQGSRGVIRTILPRRSVFSRKAAGRETTEQVVAANVDTVFIVFGLDKPVNPNAIERYLVVARRSGAEPVIVLNKADLADDIGASVAEATASAGDVPVHAVSTRTSEGVARLTSFLSTGRTVALLGPSGAGKSSIVNRLVERELLPTGEVRDWDARGRHTSVHRQLVVRQAGGLIIDTPGLRELQLWDAGDAAFADTFADIAALAGDCRFRDCRHDREPGCAVKAAVEAGTLDAGRYESYLKLQREQAAFERNRDERAGIEAKRQAKLGSKAYKALQKQRGR
ncbi:MAG: ribosome small subunit-dependent GTPase A [Acidobacteriota bacterium]